VTEASEVRGGDRVSVETAVHQLFRDLTERSNENPEAAPFMLMKDVFMWAVALGVRSGRRLPLSGAKTQIFRWDQLSQDLDVPVLKALAVAETGEVEGLLREDQVLRIAEEYANSGIRELKEALIDQPGQPLWNLVSTVRRNGDVRS
jgi:dnd system-associated protein 4